MAIHSPLDIEYWFVNVFSGSFTIFTFVIILMVTYLCARFKFEPSSYAVILVLLAGVMLAAGDSALIVLMILVLAPIFFWIVRRLVD